MSTENQNILNEQEEEAPLEGEEDPRVTAEKSLAEEMSIYPNAKVKISRENYSTTHIKTLVEKRKTLILDPDFQRHDVWGPDQGSELVESILMGIPIPIIYLFEQADGTRQVVDGRQRLTAILKFLNNKLKLRDLKILSKLNGETFDTIDPKLQGIFEDYQLSFYVIQPPTPERVKYDIFDRVNRGGTRLNSQEMRTALYKGKATSLIKDLAKSQEFICATEKGISTKRKKDEYVALRSIAFYLLWTHPKSLIDSKGNNIEYRSDIDDFLAKFMIFLNEKATDELIEECKDQFKNSMLSINYIMGHDAFRFDKERPEDQRRAINMPLFDVLMYIFTHPEIRDLDRDAVKEAVNQFKLEYDKIQKNNGNIDSSTNVKLRYDMADELIASLRFRS